MLRDRVKSCTACDLYRHATQAVFGEGPTDAKLFLIGEQPGNDEDPEGRPFVGPAGKVLDRALAEASIERGDAWISNAVKHFKFEPRGKRRIHQKPNASEVRACRPWLETEIRLVKPKLIICLGATASQTMFGPAFRLTKQRGVRLEHPWTPNVIATIHPSAILRMRTEVEREAECRHFMEDLKTAAALL